MQQLDFFGCQSTRIDAHVAKFTFETTMKGFIGMIADKNRFAIHEAAGLLRGIEGENRFAIDVEIAAGFRFSLQGEGHVMKLAITKVWSG